MTFQQMMWKVAMLLFIAMMLVNVGVRAGGGQTCGHGGVGHINCENGDVEPELDDLEKLSNAVKW